MTDVEEVRSFLGIRIGRDVEELFGSVNVLETLLRCFGMSDSIPVATSIECLTLASRTDLYTVSQIPEPVSKLSN